jgi:hypothetical protein
MARSVVDPQGTRWKVGRRWVGRRPRRRAPKVEDAMLFPDMSALADLGIGGILAVIVGVIGAAFMLILVVSVLATVVELLVLLVLLLGGLAGRVLLRRPWRVVARRTDRPLPRLAWEVVGFRASGRTIAEVAEALELGRDPRPAEATAIDVRSAL